MGEYKRLRNLCVRENEKDRRQWERDKIEECGKNSKTLWSFINRKLDKCKGGPPKRLNSGGKLVTNSREIADTQNHYYINKVNTIRKDLIEKKQDEDDPTEMLKHFIENWEERDNRGPKLCFKPLTVNQVEEIMGKIKGTTSEGIDTVSNIVLKDGAKHLASPITHIINKSLSEGVFPNQWRIAKINLYKRALVKGQNPRHIDLWPSSQG